MSVDQQPDTASVLFSQERNTPRARPVIGFLECSCTSGLRTLPFQYCFSPHTECDPATRLKELATILVFNEHPFYWNYSLHKHWQSTTVHRQCSGTVGFSLRETKSLLEAYFPKEGTKHLSTKGKGEEKQRH